jgi:hypothetical protein
MDCPESVAVQNVYAQRTRKEWPETLVNRSGATLSMRQYYVVLRQREDRPVIPVAPVLYPAGEGIGLEEYTQGVLGRHIYNAHAGPTTPW